MSRLRETTARGLIIAAVVLGSFMGATDSSIVILSLTSISRHFDVGTSEASWVLITYLLAVTGFLIPFGRLGDVMGKKNIFVAGFALFTASSFFCGASPGFFWLILFRALQGIGGAMITATGPALLSVSLPEQVRGRALGYLSAANALGLAAGFGLGGVILHFLSWKWIFYLNVPVGICAVAIAYLVIPRDAGRRMTWGSSISREHCWSSSLRGSSPPRSRSGRSMAGRPFPLSPSSPSRSCSPGSSSPGNGARRSLCSSWGS
ncbi:MFS transporter [Methanoculleus sp.]|uniref:MFS transporter n=1 Tax=Methanoculleus sp. TaxID=90427 RepID=UPI00345C118B